MSDRRQFRCAIYTRKSTDEGLDQDFNSLQAQREACEAYIKSQAHEGWKLHREAFDDGGYSGGTMERPGLQALLAAIRQQKVDVVVVYKIDRLTRSLTDFARIVDVFDANQVSFVSITQAFNTTTSMGRLTLNILLSFAQFEREVTAERIRDKIAASKKKGLWMGGLPPLGYDVSDKKLVINHEEAKTVRVLFDLYLETGSVRRLRDRTNELGLVTKRRTAADGRSTGGKPFSRGHLYRILSNPIYIGGVAHKGSTYAGQHEAIADRQTWEAVQAQLSSSRNGTGRNKNATQPSMLTGLIFDETGDRLSPSHAAKQGRRYRYYVSHRLMERSRDDDDGWRLPARELERAVIAGLATTLRDQAGLISNLGLGGASADVQHSVLRAAETKASQLDSTTTLEQQQLLRRVLARAEVRRDWLLLRLDASNLRCLLTGEEPSLVPEREGTHFEVTVPLSLQRRGVERKLVITERGGEIRQSQTDGNLVALLTTAVRALTMLTTGVAGSIEAVARSVGLPASEVTRIMPLAFVAPDIVEGILEGRQPVELTANKLKRSCPIPRDWNEQRQTLGFPPAGS